MEQENLAYYWCHIAIINNLFYNMNIINQSGLDLRVRFPMTTNPQVICAQHYKIPFPNTYHRGLR